MVEPHHCLLDDGVFIICATFLVIQYVCYIITIASCFALTQETASIYGWLFLHNTITEHFIFCRSGEITVHLSQTLLIPACKRFSLKGNQCMTVIILMLVP